VEEHDYGGAARLWLFGSTARLRRRTEHDAAEEGNGCGSAARLRLFGGGTTMARLWKGAAATAAARRGCGGGGTAAAADEERRRKKIKMYG
jgi:hypothetical protein